MFSSLSVVAVLLCVVVDHTDAHGYLDHPKPRNVIAFEKGIVWHPQPFNNLDNDLVNKTSSICGSAQEHPEIDMDVYYSFGSQATYKSGSNITVEVQVDVEHGGHFEFSLCPKFGRQDDDDKVSLSECLKQNRLDVVKYNSVSGGDGTEPLWPEYPYRAMIPPFNVRTTGNRHSYDLKLPDNLATGGYLLKWMYITANSCYPDGYPDYNPPSSWGPLWFQQWAKCGDPYSVPPPPEEVFHNCADITIEGLGTAPPTSAPSELPFNEIEATPKSLCSLEEEEEEEATRRRSIRKRQRALLEISMNGACGSGQGTRCRSGMCCSSHNNCGSSEAHCALDEGCQPEYGDCFCVEPTTSSSSPPPPPPESTATTTTTADDSTNPATPAPAPASSCSTNRCGLSWADANTNCGPSCTTWDDPNCGANENCWGGVATNLACCSDVEGEDGTEEPLTPGPGPTPGPTAGPGPTPGPTPVSTTTATTRASTPGPTPGPMPASCTSNRCGSTWSDANTKCGPSCTTWSDPNCAEGENCFWSLATTLPCCG